VKNVQQFQRYRIFPRGLFFLARPAESHIRSYRRAECRDNL